MSLTQKTKNWGNYVFSRRFGLLQKAKHFDNYTILSFSGKGQLYEHVDVAIKTFAISFLTGNTFDRFIDSINIKQNG